MIVLFLTSFFLALVGCVLLIRYARRHARHYGAAMPQRFHIGHVPRVGGVAIFVATGLGWLVAALQTVLGNPLNSAVQPAQVGAWLLLSLPALLGGGYEDLTQRVAVRYRLVLTLLTAALACTLLGLTVPRLGLVWIDGWWAAYPWLGVILAVLAITGLPHAFNIIDGYNGLAASVALVVGLALIHVALQNGDRSLALWLACMCGATLGFLVWNYPLGLIFAGDGGAYFWGVVIAVASIALVQRNPDVSPWFPVLLLIYPVWETVFSIYRKAARGVSPGVADALHIHQLICRRIVRTVFDDDETHKMLMRNNRTTPYLWGFIVLTTVPAVLFWRYSAVLIAFSLLFVVSYVYAYLSIVRFKAQRWVGR